jgi:LuxR family quorum sensing-dependent transcriptional regulator
MLVDLGFQFIERCARDPDARSRVEDFRTTMRDMGFHGWACGAWAGVGKKRRHRYFFIDWPADWLALYNENCWVEQDLLPIEARRRVVPFLWSELDRSKLTPGQQALVDAGLAYGWRDAFAVPVHGPGSLQGLITIATRTDLALSAPERAVLEVMARTVWELCRTSADFDMSAPEPIHLSAREVECLQWAAAGKSDRDIAKVLGIKPATAHFHIEQAKRRLKAKSRVEAVAIGVLHGLL